METVAYITIKRLHTVTAARLTRTVNYRKVIMNKLPSYLLDKYVITLKILLILLNSFRL